MKNIVVGILLMVAVTEVRGCYQGFYESGGNCYPCPQGKYCPNQDAPVDCPPHLPYAKIGSSTCEACPAGLACTPGASYVVCSDGEYALAGDGVCTSCPKGYRCPDRTAAPIACSAGYYTTGGATFCSPCNPGQYCPSTTDTPKSCPSGTYSGFGETSCTPCPAGKYCPRVDLGQLDCLSGEYSLGMATSCTRCEAGKQCPSKTAPGTVCAPGTFSLSGQTACTQCPAGYKCTLNDRAPTELCGAGTYSLAGQTSCTPCPMAQACPYTYQAPSSGQNCPSGYYQLGEVGYCKQCEPGYECPSQNQRYLCGVGQYSKGMTSCTDCPAGKYCPTTTREPLTCPSGTTCPQNSVAYLDCPIGYACSNPSVTPVKCTTGYYSLGKQQSCTICPDGFFCPSTTAPPLQCAPGYYTTGTGKTECTQCPAGSYCIGSLSSHIKTTGSGYYSYAGMNTYIQCIPGYFCAATDGTANQACQVGYTSGFTQSSSCTICPAGQACPTTSAYDIYDCPSGTYSTTGMTYCLTCPAGYSCTTSSITECNTGEFSQAGAITCTACPAGHYCPYKNAPHVLPCPPGTYSTGSATSCTVCESGYECKKREMHEWCSTLPDVYAPRGSYICAPCPGGLNCSGEVASSCPLGQYSSSDDDTCRDCPSGHYCPTGTSKPIRCPPGTHAPGVNNVVCKGCPLGSYAEEAEAVCQICAAGSYCSAPHLVPQPCPPGTFSSINSSYCTPCTPGFYCALGSTSASVSCPEGHYCNYITSTGLGGMGKMPCPAGTFRGSTGAKYVSDCGVCTAGKFCLEGTITPANCPKGHYCPAGTQYGNQFPCPAGTYNNVQNQDAATDCQDCTVGNYCPTGAVNPLPCPPGYFCPAKCGYLTNNQLVPAGYYTDFTPQASGTTQVCPTGNYCPVGCVMPIPCPPGRYRATTGGMKREECLKCNAGTVCARYGNTAAAGTACPKGYYCPAGTEYPTQYPCPPGTYGAATSLTSESLCTKCPAGFACDEATNDLTNPKQRCQPGFYCPAGSKSPKQIPCPAGKFSNNYENANEGDCSETCESGYYCLRGSDRITGECHEGYYCPPGSTKPNEVPCPAGTYSKYRRLRASHQCDVCPLGYYCPPGTSVPLECPGGTYNDNPAGIGAVGSCKICEGGYYCPRGAANHIECGMGKYSPAGSAQCFDCLPHYYCDSNTTSDTVMLSNLCQGGYYCPQGTGSLNSQKCPAGSYCPLGSDRHTLCSPGYVAAEGSAICIQIEAGNFTVLGSGVATSSCKVGYYCPTGSWNVEAVFCPGGTYRNTSGAAIVGDCHTCPQGYYCPEATVDPLLCPQGYYCVAGSSVPTKCAKGTYGEHFGLAEQSECSSCPSGTYCSLPGLSAPEGLCDAGYYCVSGAMISTPTDGVTGGICPEGGFCETGSRVSQSCPPGRYNPSAGGRDLDACILCPPGKYCSGSAKNTYTGECEPGYYCPTGSYMKNMRPAPPGYYTTVGKDEPIPCAEGYYNPYYAQSACLKCPPGFLCKNAANAGTFQNCPTGSYCPEFSVLATACPKGKYNPNYNGKSEDDCYHCPPGKYCSIEGLDKPGDGTANDPNCDAGYYCKTLSDTKAPEAEDSLGRFGPCPLGFYCPKGISNPIPCPPGKYSDVPKIYDVSQCKDCTAGSYCTAGGLSLPEGLCGVGYYCPLGSKVIKNASRECSIGHYCPQGSPAEIECAAGTYQDERGQGSCKDCPPGYFCPQGTFTLIGKDCPVGYYCPKNTPQSNQNPCPIGTYNPRKNAHSLAHCILADPGYYVLSTGNHEVTGKCKPGYYCKLGSPTDQPPSTANGAPADHGNECPLGSFCPEGSAMPLKCPGGKYCSQTKLATSQGNCNAGYYCRLGATSRTPTNLVAEGGDKCTAGHYCPAGSDSPTPCPPGTYSSNSGNTQLSDCQICPTGKYCQNAGVVTYTGTCSPGYYCKPDTGATIGFTSPNPYNRLCPIGYRCPAGTLDKMECVNSYQDQQGKADCNSCPEGYYCTTTQKILCQPRLEYLSYYCPANIMDKVTCPAGTYNVIDGSNSITDCVKCPTGYYCPVSDSLPKIIPCPAGTYCKEEGNSKSTGDGNCPAGHYCPVGTYDPIPCPAGKYCDAEGLTDSILANDAYNCNEGYICYGQSVTPTPTDGVKGNICPAGFFCERGTKAPTACPIGYYRSLMGGVDNTSCTECTVGFSCSVRGLDYPQNTCPPGFYCTIGTSINITTSCPIGAKCPSGSSYYEVCPDKYYQNKPQQTVCTDCPARFYCKNYGQLSNASKPTECPAGKYCPAKTDNPYDCPTSTFSPRKGLAAESECESCTPGTYCETSGLTAPTGECDAGYYCTGGSKSKKPNDATGNMCSKGHYCPQGSTNPIPCPPGTYSDLMSQIALSNCTTCPSGYFCPLRGSTSMDLKFGASDYKCREGFLCIGSSTIPNPTDGVKGKMCRAGYYCPQGTTIEIPCTKGYYNPNPGQKECFECPAGKLCNTDSMSNPVDCPAGSYCPQGTYQPIACPAGTYSPFLNLESKSECIDCDPGKYCEGGKTVHDGLCDAGYVCVRKSPVKFSYGLYSQAANSNGQCPMGYKCPAGCSAPIPCPIGEYNNEPGKTECKLCPTGKYCDELGMTGSSKECAAGHVCVSGAKFARPVTLLTDGGRLCNAGHYCPQGTTADKQCPVGRWEPRQGSSACQLCPKGYYCPNLGTTNPLACPAENYCPEGSSSPIACPDGTFGRPGSDKLERDDQCLQCPSGKYCKNGQTKGDCNAGYYCDVGASKAADVNKLCPAGHYCLAGAKLPTRCPDGKFNMDVGASAAIACIECTAGYYCIAGSSVPIACPRGHYCVQPASKPDQCQKGYYQPYTLQTLSTSCTKCPSGTFCYENATYDPSMYPCPVGKYCLEAIGPSSYSPYDCVNGTYRNTTGAKSVDECLPCPGGFYCLEATVHPKPCRGGYYCNGTTTELDCPAGRYCPPMSQSPVNCPAAYYCPEKSEIYIKCENGYYCPENSATATPCPAGFVGSYNPNNINVALGCTQCTPGFYSLMQDGLLECLPCSAGYVCLGGTTIAKPTSVTEHRGQVCPLGYYCPLGTYEPFSCPKGTYNAEIAKTSIADCLKCPESQFNPTYAQSACRTCGSSSVSSSDGTTCVCKGKFRAYQVETQKCLCKPQYEPVDGSSTEDSTVDCQPVIFDRCGNSQIRDPSSGKCVESSHCPECPEGKGTRSAGIGQCECTKVDVLDNVCNDTCRSNSYQIKVDYSGNLVIHNPLDPLNDITISRASLSGLFGTMGAPSSTNKVVSIGCTATGGFSANYQPATSISNLLGNSGTRLLTSGRRLSSVADSGISNPIVCLNLGDTMVFTITPPSNYPYYDKDNLLNTNPNFDYSNFELLDSELRSGKQYTEFAFTFIESGRFVFKNKVNPSQLTIVGVMASNEKCSDDSRYIQPISTSSLLKLGLSQNEDLILTPDWGLIFGLIAAILFGTPLLIGFIKYFSSSSWIKPKPDEIKYRQLNQQSDYDEFTSKGKEWKRELYNKPEEESQLAAAEPLGVLVDEDNPLIVKPNKKEKQIIKMRKKENIEGVHEISSDIFRDLYKELQYHAKFVKDEFARKAGMDSDNIKKVFAEIDRLKLLMQDKLQNIAKSYGRGIKLIFSDKAEGEGLFIESDEEKREKKEEGEEMKEGELMSSESEEEKVDERVEFNPEILEEIDQNDQQKIDLIAEKIRNEQAEVEKEWEDTEKVKYEKFVEEIRENKKLSPDEKQRLIDEYRESSERMKKLLMIEEQSSENRLKQLLEQRRKRRDQMRDEIEKIEIQKREVDGNFMEERKQIDKEKQAIHAAIDQEIEKEKAEEIEKLEKKKNDELQAVRKKFQKKLKGDLSEGQRNTMLDKFSGKMKALEEELEMARKREQDEILMKLDMKRQNRRAERELELKRREKEQKEQENKELKVLNAQLTMLNDNLKNEQMDEMISKVKEEQPRNEEESLALARQVESNKEKEMEKLIESDAKLEEQRKMMLRQEQEELRQLEKERSAADGQIQAKVDEVRNRKSELSNLLAKAASPAEKRKLLEEYQRYESDVAEQVKGELGKQNSKFEERMAERRRQRAAKEIGSKEAQDLEIEELRRANRREEAAINRKINEQKLQKEIEKLKLMLTQEEIPFAVEKLIDDMQMEELAELLRQQLHDKALILRRNMEKLLSMKAQAVQQLKDDLDNQGRRAKELVEKGLMKKEEYKVKLEELKLRKENASKELDYEYAQKQSQLEEKSMMEQERRNSEELIDMTRYHGNQKQLYMQAFVSDDFLKRILGGDKFKMDEDISEYEKELNQEYETKRREIEEKRQKVEELMRLNENKINDLEAQAHKMLEEQEMREKKREERQKREFQEQLESKQEEIQQKKGITDEEKRRLMEEHQVEFNRLVELMEKERARQSEAVKERIQEKLKQKEMLKQQREAEMKRMKEQKEKELESKIAEIQKEKGMETEEEKSHMKTLGAKYEKTKYLYEKIKPLAGVDLQPDREEENVLKGILESKKRSVKDSNKLDLDFDMLFSKLRMLESSVSTITGVQFDQILSGFMDINNKIDNITSGVSARSKPSAGHGGGE